MLPKSAPTCPRMHQNALKCIKIHVNIHNEAHLVIFGQNLTLFLNQEGAKVSQTCLQIPRNALKCLKISDFYIHNGTFWGHI